MGCPTCYETTSPEIVPVTINQQIVNIENSPAMFRNEVFSFGDASDNRTFGLYYFPYEPSSVKVYLNSGAQRYGVDYEVHGQYVVMDNALISGDQILVHYLSVEGTVASQGSSVGSIVASAGTTLGTGFLLMDGTTVHLWANNLALKNWFWSGSSNGDIGNPAVTDNPGYTRRTSLLVNDYTGTSFKLVRLQDAVYDGTTLLTLNKFISRGAAA